MQGFKQFIDEAMSIATNCDQFGPDSQTKGWWFAGAGSDLGCHKKKKLRTLKMKFKENLFGTPGTETGYWKAGLNTGSGGGPGKASEIKNAIDNKKDNKGCGGGAGPCPDLTDKNKTKNTGCWGGPAAGACQASAAGCSGYSCFAKS
jgi:hypothetical protein